MLGWIVFLVVLALFFLVQAARRQDKAGLPGGRIIYTDTKGWQDVDQPLYDPTWDLTGKPDYLIRQGKAIVPVEVKTGRTPNAPYDSHIYQLAAYCLLVHQVYAIRPEYGLIKYPQRTFQIDYTPGLEASLKDLLDEIRAHKRKKSVARSHEHASRCRRCGYRNVCEERLG